MRLLPIPMGSNLLLLLKKIRMGSRTFKYDSVPFYFVIKSQFDSIWHSLRPSQLPISL